jgi:hypothetical protein
LTASDFDKDPPLDVQAIANTTRTTDYVIEPWLNAIERKGLITIAGDKIISQCPQLQVAGERNNVERRFPVIRHLSDDAKRVVERIFPKKSLPRELSR